MIKCMALAPRGRQRTHAHPVEGTAGSLIGGRVLSPKISLVGGVLPSGLPLTTTSLMLSTRACSLIFMMRLLSDDRVYAPLVPGMALRGASRSRCWSAMAGPTIAGSDYLVGVGAAIRGLETVFPEPLIIAGVVRSAP